MTQPLPPEGYPNAYHAVTATHANTYKMEHAQSHLQTLTRPSTYDKISTATLQTLYTYYNATNAYKTKELTANTLDKQDDE